MLSIVDRIGYQALFDEENFFDAIDFAKENDFPVVEVNLNSPHFLPEKLDRVERLKVKHYSEEKGVRLILHAPEGMGIINLQTKVREVCTERIKELIDFANQIGADRITCHLGSSVPIVSCGERVLLHTVYKTEYREALIKSLNELSQYSKDKTLLCIENTSGFRYDFVQELLPEFLQNGIYLTWDIGHTNYLKGELHEREFDFFLNHLDRVRVAHIHDNYGSRDEHNVVGEGTVDFVRFLSLLNSSSTELIFEVRPRKEALKCRENLRRILAKANFQNGTFRDS